MDFPDPEAHDARILLLDLYRNAAEGGDDLIPHGEIPAKILGVDDGFAHVDCSGL